MYLITEDMPEVAAWNAKTGEEIMHAVDFDGELYLRQERRRHADRGLTSRSQQATGHEFSTPWNFGHELLAPDIDRIAPSLEVGFRAFPGLPEHRHQANHQRALHLCAGRQSAGRTGARPAELLGRLWRHGRLHRRAAASGKSLAELDDLRRAAAPTSAAMDIARYGDCAANREYINARRRVQFYSRRRFVMTLSQ